ncbi:MAG: hypothetical protein WBM62_06470, partial [Crocosphaera sp.]
MNTLQLLKQNLEKLRQKYQSRRRSLLKENQPLEKKSSSTTLNNSDWLAKLHKSKPIRQIHPPLMWGIAVISLTSVIGYRFYNQPQLSAGTVSPVTVVAPKDGTFQDEKTTEEKRKEVRTGIIPVIQRDPELTRQLQGELTETIAEIKQLRQQTGLFPFINVKFITLSTQQYLRNVDEKDWQIIQSAITKGDTQKIPESKAQLKQAITQLNNYGKATSPATLKGLLETIKQSRQRYNQAKIEVSNTKTSYLTPEVFTTFLNLDDNNWQTTEKTLKTTLNRILLQGLPPGIPDYLLKEIIKNQLESTTSSVPQPAITQLLMKILHNQHNLTVDKEATKQRAEQAAQAVETVLVEIKAGDVIIEAGDKITQEEFVLLDSFELSRRGINWVGLGISAIFVMGSVSVFCLVGQKIHRPMRRRDHMLLCLLSLSTPLLGIFNLGYTNLPAVGLLTSSFYGPTLAITQVVFLSGLSTFAATTI